MALRSAITEEIRITLRDSLPVALTRDALDRLLVGATLRETAAGEHLDRDGSGRFTFLVLRGLIRLYMISSAGRQVTVRYARRGELTGLSSVFSEQAVRFQAMTTVEALHVRPETLSEAVRTDTRVAYAVVAQTSRSLVEFQREIGRQAFQSVRQRTVRHLLDLAAPGPTGAVVAVTQQELADAVGSTRENVARELGELRSEGVIRTSQRKIVIVDPEALHRTLSAP
jgi:CRP/FNR family transcriptional regulator